MTNNTNNTRCDEYGLVSPGQEVWWYYVVTFATIYIVMLGLSCISYGLYLIVKRHKQESLTMQTKDARRRFNEIVRLLLSGDSIISKILILVTFACNLIFMILTVHRTFEQVEYCFTSKQPARVVEVIITLELMFFALIRLLAANNIVWFWFNIFTIIDVLTLPHIFVSIALNADWIGLRSARFFWLIQFITVLRFIPWIKSQNLLDFATLCTYFFILVSFGAGLVHLSEHSGDPWLNSSNSSNANVDHNIFTYGYYILVTISTVGYGDIKPTTTFSRLFMSVYIIIGLVFFAALLPLISDVFQYFHTSRTYASFDRSRVPRHVIVCGHITAFTAQEFLKDFLHPDRGDTNTHVLFLNPDRPTRKLRNVLRSYFTRVQYVVGSVLDSKDLRTCKLFQCSAVFILVDKHTNNPLEEDNGNLLRLVSIKNLTVKIRVIIQLFLSSSKEQVRNIEGWNPGDDIAVCLNELKLGLLAQSCMCPGFSTLIANLFYTSDFPALKTFQRGNEWKVGYMRGASNEIYATHFSPSFSGKNFQQVAHVCYNRLGLILIAIESPVGRLQKFEVNPLNSESQIETGLYGSRGYFIGQNVDHVGIVSRYCETCDDNLTIRENVFEEEVRKFVRKVSLRKCNCFPVLKEVVSHCQLSETELEEVRDERSNTFTKRPSHWAVSFAVEYDDDESDIDSQLSYPQNPINLEEIVLKTEESLCMLKKVPGLENHIVVCVFADDKSPLLGLQSIISPLRTKNVSRNPIVIISNGTFLKREWPLIQHFSDVYVVEGSPLRIQNYAAASIESCNVCIITTMLSADSNEPAINDKEVVLCSLSIQKYLKKKATRKVQIIADLRQESNVQFLDFGDEDEPDERIYKAQPFACGEAFSVSMMDSVTSSAFHSPGTLYLVEDLIQCSGTRTRTRTSCQIVGVPLDSGEYAGKTFQDLYNFELDKKNLVLGLFRKLPERNNTGTVRRKRSVSRVKGGVAQDKHYVVTAPHPKTLLEPTDIGFILVNVSEC